MIEIKKIIIDGYNALFEFFKEDDSERYRGLDPRYASIPRKYLNQCFERKKMNLEKDRDTFLSSLWEKLEDIYHSRGIEIWVIFDSKGVRIHQFRRYGMKIVFTPKGKTADDFIRREVKNSQGECLVVTRDRKLTKSLKEIDEGVKIAHPWIFLRDPQRTLRKIEEEDLARKLF